VTPKRYGGIGPGGNFVRGKLAGKSCLCSSDKKEGGEKGGKKIVKGRLGTRLRGVKWGSMFLK